MTAARDTKECLRLERWITAYVDDQLDAVHILEVEEHLGACEGCREQNALTRALQDDVKAVDNGCATRLAPGQQRRPPIVWDALQHRIKSVGWPQERPHTRPRGGVLPRFRADRLPYCGWRAGEGPVPHDPVPPEWQL